MVLQKIIVFAIESPFSLMQVVSQSSSDRRCSFLFFFTLNLIFFLLGLMRNTKGCFKTSLFDTTDKVFLSAVPVKAAIGVPLEINITIFRSMIFLETTVKTYKVCLLFWSCYWQ